MAHEQTGTEDQEVLFTHELIGNHYILTASEAATGRMLSKISLPYSAAVMLLTGMVRTLLGDQ